MFPLTSAPGVYQKFVWFFFHVRRGEGIGKLAGFMFGYIIYKAFTIHS